MRSRLISFALTLAVGAAVLAPIGALAAESAIALHPDVWAAFEDYRQDRRAGAFAVSADGRSFGTSLCRETRCDFAGEKRNALQDCRANGGDGCVVFAVGDDVKLGHRLLTREELSVCPFSPVPRITVRFVYDFRGTSHTHDLAYLAEMMKDDERQWLGDHGTVMGVTEHRLRFDSGGVRYISVDGRDGHTCAGFEDGVIRLALTASVYVAREIPDTVCLYREVLDHEMKHRSLGQQMTEAFARDLEAQLAAALEAQPFAEVPDGTGWRQTASARLDQLIDDAYRVFGRELSRSQLGVDSNVEYKRVDDACPGEQDKYVP